jgi:hypothetical protein
MSLKQIGKNFLKDQMNENISESQMERLEKIKLTTADQNRQKGELVSLKSSPTEVLKELEDRNQNQKKENIKEEL